MRKIKIGQTEYQYFLEKQKRKTFALTISPNMSINVKAPVESKMSEIEKFLRKKVLWIDKQLHFFALFKKEKVEKEYISGESFLYLGRRYMLKVEQSNEERVVLQRGRINAFVRNKKQENVKELLDRWFKKRAETIFNQRLKEVLQKFDYDFVPELKMRKMSKRWGSYHSAGKIILNPLLIHARKQSIDYVITHELCHVVHKNHSKAFYTLLEEKFPYWENEKNKLEILIFSER